LAVNENRSTAASDGDGDGTNPTQLARDLQAEIHREGPITFATFMERALYDPEHGYYTCPRSPWGRGGDYLTAPQVHSAVGAAIARLAAETDEVLGHPAPFTLIEAGSGDGQLMADVCDALAGDHPNLYERTRVWSVERSPASRERQSHTLQRHAARVGWAESFTEIPDSGVRGGVFSNELFDALPVHRVVALPDGVHEIYVAEEAGRFTETVAGLSTPRLSQYLDINGIDLCEGQVAEISLAAGDWMEAAADKLSAGFVLTIDYGAKTEVLYGPDRQRGSLVCQRRYQLSADPFRHVGEQDISAHVDFGNLCRRGLGRGLVPLGLESLQIFLLGFGVTEGSMIDPDDPEATRRHLALRHLLFSEIGEAHRVLLQVAGLPTGELKFGRERLG
jgi:SAM-dependent MidA family methyltransferase